MGSPLEKTHAGTHVLALKEKTESTWSQIEVVSASVNCCVLSASMLHLVDRFGFRHIYQQCCARRAWMSMVRNHVRPCFVLCLGVVDARYLVPCYHIYTFYFHTDQVCRVIIADYKAVEFKIKYLLGSFTGFVHALLTSQGIGRIARSPATVQKSGVRGWGLVLSRAGVPLVERIFCSKHNSAPCNIVICSIPYIIIYRVEGEILLLYFCAAVDV